jgi:type II secretory pathway predicted ATPase ExeA
MLLDYYNLKEQPFGATPDPRYLYMSPTHREALASLCYGIQGARGFVSLIAKPGMGKTTILFQLLNELQSSARAVFLFQTFCRPEDMLRAILRELGAPDENGDLLHMQSQFADILVAEAQQGRRVIIVIDEAQNLDDSALEFVRMLSNCETPTEKLLHIVLGGQLQFREKLASPQWLQLEQRISIFARLRPLNFEETHLYIEHRLRVAGYNFQVPLFAPQAVALIARKSEGIPRNINNICFNALSLGWVLKQRTIEKGAIREVLNDLDCELESNRGWQKVLGAGRIGWNVVKPKNVLQHTFSRRSWIALLAILLPPLFWISARERRSGPVPDTSSAVVSEAALRHEVSLPVEHAESSRKTGDATSKSPPSPQATLNASTRSPSSSETRTSVPPRTDLSLLTADPATLWKQVKVGRVDAEIELAVSYLVGKGVEENCSQARVLLQDASRKGNARATDLLANLTSQCH